MLSELGGKPLPVEIAGIGALSSLKDRELDEKQLTAVVKTVVEKNAVSEEDAAAAAAIYERQMPRFLDACASSQQTDGVISRADVESYLALILRHQDLQAKIGAITTDAVVKTIAEKTNFSGEDLAIGPAGYLQATYYNAYSRTTAKNDEKSRVEKYVAIGTANMLASLTASERAAQEIVNDKRKNVNDPQKKQAAEFLRDLKIYNDALPDKEKILDDGGRLLNFQKASDSQTTRMIDIVLNNTATINENKEEVIKAVNRVNKKTFSVYSLLYDDTFSLLRPR